MTIDASESPSTTQLIANYEHGPDALRSAVAGIAAAQLRERPIAGKWSTLEVVCYVADTEQFFADRMKRTLAMDRPLLVSADGWRYPEAVRYHDRELGEELALIALTRRQMARILKSVPEAAWARPAVHTEMGLVTLHSLLAHAVRHLLHHVGFIDEKRAALALRQREDLGWPGLSLRSPGLALHRGFEDSAPATQIQIRSRDAALVVEPGPGADDDHEVSRRGEFAISTNRDRLDAALIHDFLANRSYWAQGRPLDVVRRSIENSLCFGLYDGDKQIGFARMVTDRATFAWLCDVYVLEAYRGRGLSKWLVECVMRHPDLQGLRRILLGTRDAHDLYARYGFTPLTEPHRFMEVFRPNLYACPSESRD